MSFPKPPTNRSSSCCKRRSGRIALRVPLTLALASFSFHGQPSPGAATVADNLKDESEKLGTEYVSKRAGAALTIGLWQNGAERVRGFGTISDTNASPPDGETLYEIGSITKVFTGIILAVMAEQQAVQLEAPISNYLPRGIHSPKNGREIRLLDLATHASGLPRLPPNFGSVSTDQQNPYARYKPADLYRGLAEVSLPVEPGTKSEYSNYGFALLGQLLASKAGKPYEQLVRETICTPLGLTNTAITLSPEQKQRLTPGHDPKGRIVPNWDMEAFEPAGGLRSDANDLLKFLAANLNPTSCPMSGALLTAQQRHFQRGSQTVGLGWQIRNGPEGHAVHWHNGGTGGYVSFLGFDQRARVGVVLLSNYGDIWSGDYALDRMGMRLLQVGAKSSSK